jgi:DNA (cytosine-5)-methyltransferase 1
MWGEMARIICEVQPRFVFVENSPMLTSRGLGRVLGDLASMGFDARWGVLGAADVGANHQRDRIWIVATNMAHTGGKGRKFDKHVRNIDGREICRSVSKQGENGRKQSLDNALFTGLEGKNYQQESPEWIQQEPGQRCNQISNSSSLGLSGQGQYEQSINPTQGKEREAVEFVYGRSPDFWAIEPNVGRVADGVAARVDRLKAIGNGQVPLCAATAWRILSAGV